MSWRALSLWEPWASAIPAGLKTVETRGWATSWRGPLLICAAQKVLSSREFAELPEEPRLWARQQLDSGGLAFGHAIATARLAGCVPAELIRWQEPGALGEERWRLGTGEQAGELLVDERERPWGLYESAWGQPKRIAWLLADVRPLLAPVPMRGRQGLWQPDEDAFRLFVDGSLLVGGSW